MTTKRRATFLAGALSLAAGCGRELYDANVDASALDVGRGDAGLTCLPGGPIFGDIEPLGMTAPTVTTPSLSHDGLRLTYLEITRITRAGEMVTVATVHELVRSSREGAFGPDAVLTDGPLVALGEGLRAHVTRVDEIERFVALDVGAEQIDLFVQTRSSPSAEWASPTPVMAAGASIAVPGFQEWDPYLSADGLTLWFQRERTGPMATSQIHTLTRPSLTASFGAEATLAESVVGAVPGSPSLTLDGTALYFSLDGDLYVSELEGGAWSGRRTIGEIEAVPAARDYEPLIRPDGCELFWVRQVDSARQQMFHAMRSPGGSL